MKCLPGKQHILKTDVHVMLKLLLNVSDETLHHITSLSAAARVYSCLVSHHHRPVLVIHYLSSGS